jgi:lysozyme
MTPAGVELIRFFEGLRLEAYPDISDNKTIGYGHLLKPGESGKPITKQEGESLLMMDIAEHEKAVLTITSGSNGVTAEMESALTCLAFNIGVDRLAKSSVIRMAIAGDFPRAAVYFMKFCKAKNPKTGKLEPVDGLLKRRMAEAVLFLTGEFDAGEWS